MKEYHAFVHAIVGGVLDNLGDVEEVIQDTFANAYRGLPQLKDTATFKGWLTEIARNCARDRLRKRRLETVPIDEVRPHTLETPDAADVHLIRDEQIELIRRAMEALSQKDREIAQAYYLDGASYDELIRTHGLSYKAISFRLSRAKRALTKRLRHLLSGVFLPPATILKKIGSRGLTAMKIGTVPKITIGVIALIALAFIGSRQLLSPEEDSVPSARALAPMDEASSPSVAEAGTTRADKAAAPSLEDEPQISAEEMEQIEDFFAQLEAAEALSEADSPQLAADAEIRQIADEGAVSEPLTKSEGTTQSAEDVMNAYVGALKNLDFDAMLSLETAAAREETRDFLGDFDNNLSNPMVRGMLQSMFSRAEIVGSEYVGDEFHFRLRVPLRVPILEGLQFPEGLEPAESLELLEVIPENDISLYKMRKEDGEWRIYKQ